MMRSELFRLCPQKHPEFGCACVRVNGHEMELGGHTDGHGLWWDETRVCESPHPFKRGVVCVRPWGHPGPHDTSLVRWSK